VRYYNSSVNPIQQPRILSGGPRTRCLLPTFDPATTHTLQSRTVIELSPMPSTNLSVLSTQQLSLSYHTMVTPSLIVIPLLSEPELPSPPLFELNALGKRLPKFRCPTSRIRCRSDQLPQDHLMMGAGVLLRLLRGHNGVLTLLFGWVIPTG
jgi:hypothetical protein